MNSGRRNELLAAEAADWVIALGDADRETRKAFAAWLRTSPEHIREFLAVSAIWSAMPGVSARPSAEELVRMARTQANVIPVPGLERFPARKSQSRRILRRRWAGRAAAAAVLALAAAAILLEIIPGGNRNLHATGIGEHASVPLPDGSAVTLNTRSTIRVAYSAQHRDVHLVGGEALFEVEEDVSRPFRVITQQGVIEALGTQFNVRVHADEVTVTVVEGVVAVSAGDYRPDAGGQPADLSLREDAPSTVQIRTGQQLRLRSGSPAAEVIETALEKTITWRERRLVFEALPLEQVIEEFNRYNDPPAVIDSESLKSLPISGVFRSDDLESFLQFLSQMELAEFSERDDGAIVLTGGTDG